MESTATQYVIHFQGDPAPQTVTADEITHDGGFIKLLHGDDVVFFAPREGVLFVRHESDGRRGE